MKKYDNDKYNECTIMSTLQSSHHVSCASLVSNICAHSQTSEWIIRDSRCVYVMSALGGELNAELSHWLLEAPLVHSPARAIIVP